MRKNQRSNFQGKRITASVRHLPTLAALTLPQFFPRRNK
jgi:hypothetical protein